MGDLKLNPFFRVRLTKPLSCDLLLDGTSLDLPDRRYLQILAAASTGATREALVEAARGALEIETDDAEHVIADLVEHRVLMDAGAPTPELPAVRHWIERGWLDGLILHLRSRNLDFNDNASTDPVGTVDAWLAERIAKEGLPEIWKTYAGKPVFPLPEAAPPPDEPLDQVLLRRRSNGPFSVKTISGAQLSSFLELANHETKRLRTAAENALGTHPSELLNSSFSSIETYVAIHSVEGFAPGLYHYDPRDHRLTQLKAGDLRAEVTRVAIGQRRAAAGACTFFMTGHWKRYMFRYRHSRAYRTLLVNVAELAQKYILLGTAFGLSTFLTPSLIRDAEDLLEVDGYEEAPLYVVSVG